MNAHSPMNRQILESLAGLSLGSVLAMIAREFPEGIPATNPPNVIHLPASPVAVEPPVVIALPAPVETVADTDAAAVSEDSPGNVVAFPVPALAESPAVEMTAEPQAPEIAPSATVPEADAAPAPEAVDTPVASPEPITTTRQLRLVCDRQALAAALASVNRVVEKRATIPILANALIREAGADAITVEATDLDMVVRVTVPVASVTPGFAVTVPVHLLADLLKRAGEGEAAFDVEETTVTRPVVVAAEGAGEETDSDGKPEEEAAPEVTVTTGPLAIICGPMKSRLQTLPVADYPDLAPGEFVTTFTVAAGSLADAVGTVEFAVSTEETRYYLNGVYMHGLGLLGAQTIRMVATDGHRLAMIDLADATGQAPVGIIIPRKAMALAGKLAAFKPAKPKRKRGEAPPAGPVVTVDASATKIRLACGDTVIISKLIDGSYPDYQRVVPAGNEKVLRIDAAEFAAAVRRVAVINDERGRAVRMEIDAGRIALSANNPETGHVTDSLTGVYENDAMTIGFNNKYAVDILARISGEAVFRMADPGSPILIEPAGVNVRKRFVLMPMRV